MTYDIDQRVRARTRRALLWLVAGLVVAVAATVVIVVAAQDPEPSSGKPKQDVRPPNVSETYKNKAVTVPQEELDRITWVQSRGAWFPVSADAGPKKQTDNLASNFARKPLGAVLAALHIAERASSASGSSIFIPTIQKQLIGDNLEQFLARTQEAYDEELRDKRVNEGEALSISTVNFIGFQLEHYDGSYAVIHLLIAGPNAEVNQTLAADFRVEVRWVENDWRVVVPVDETWASAMSPAQQENVYLMFPERG